MSKDFPVRNPPLADQVYEMVLQNISDGTYPRGSMLPSENLLAEHFRVSRPTIRIAFARLIERGYVIRRQGVGTLVAEMPSIANPLYQYIDIIERISSRGLEPGFKQLKAEIIQANSIQGNNLDVEVGSDILNILKVFTANGKPIICFENFIPKRVYGRCMTDEQALQPGITEPLFRFFREICKHPVKYLTSTIRPEISQNTSLAEVLEISGPNETLLHIEDIGFDKNDIPIFSSIEYLTKEASSLHVVRQVEKD